MSTDAPRRPLGQILITRGILSEDQLRIALLEQMKANQPIGKLLVSLGFVSEATLREALSESLGRQSIDLSNAIVDPQALKFVPRDVAKRHHLLPLDYDEASQRLTLAASDTRDIVGFDKVRSLLPEHVEIETLLAGESEIDRAIDQYYGYELSIDGILHEIETGEIDWKSLSASDDEYSQPVVRLIDSILTDSVKRDVSDIHFEPEATFLRIRYRIDGMLRQIRALHKSYWPAMTVRIKVLSGMNIAEMRAPQDGRIGLTVSGRQVDFRFAGKQRVDLDVLGQQGADAVEADDVVDVGDRHRQAVARFIEIERQQVVALGDVARHQFQGLRVDDGIREVDALAAEAFRQRFAQRRFRNETERNQQLADRLVGLHLLEQGDAQLILGEDALGDEDLA